MTPGWKSAGGKLTPAADYLNRNADNKSDARIFKG
jgi:hypothetical protein